jgi:methionyl aminopeptidase
MRKLSRNDPCWCGSGKKYKHCHLKQDLAMGRRAHPGSKRADGIVIKTEEQIEGIRRSSQLTREILDLLETRIAAGITTDDINRWVHDYTVSHGAIPAPLNYRGFPKSVCTSINHVVCHGIPDGTVLQEGDILNVDVTTILGGYFGDSSRMFLIGNVSHEARRLVQVTRECLSLAIDQVRPGHSLGDIGHAIQQHAERHGCSVVRVYVGHGTGIRFHEPPQVRHYGKPGTGPILEPNMVFTIEPMINAGGYQIRVLEDGWTAVTADGSLSAQWEHTVRVTEDGVEVLTA